MKAKVAVPLFLCVAFMAMATYGLWLASHFDARFGMAAFFCFIAAMCFGACAVCETDS